MISFPLLGNSGRLGNQLWQVASTIGIAEAQGDRATFPKWSYQHVFSVPETLFDDQPGTLATEFVPYLKPVARDYLQDLSLWSDVQDLIRDFLEPSHFAEMTLQDKCEEMLELPRPLISLHVRRGDNATSHLRGEEGYHPLRPLSYYEDGLRLLGPGSVVVFSDDIPWCRKNIAAAHYFEGGPARPKEHEPAYKTAPVLDWIDLLAMTKCDAHILSNSTYSWWGAWLAKGEDVIYPSPWFGPKLNEINADLMFPPEWTRLEHGR